MPPAAVGSFTITDLADRKHLVDLRGLEIKDHASDRRVRTQQADSNALHLSLIHGQRPQLRAWQGLWEIDDQAIRTCDRLDVRLDALAGFDLDFGGIPGLQHGDLLYLRVAGTTGTHWPTSHRDPRHCGRSRHRRLHRSAGLHRGRPQIGRRRSRSCGPDRQGRFDCRRRSWRGRLRGLSRRSCCGNDRACLTQFHDDRLARRKKLKWQRRGEIHHHARHGWIDRHAANAHRLDRTLVHGQVHEAAGPGTASEKSMIRRSGSVTTWVSGMTRWLVWISILRPSPDFTTATWRICAFCAVLAGVRDRKKLATRREIQTTLGRGFMAMSRTLSAIVAAPQYL